MYLLKNLKKELNLLNLKCKVLSNLRNPSKIQTIIIIKRMFQSKQYQLNYLRIILITIKNQLLKLGLKRNAVPINLKL